MQKIMSVRGHIQTAEQLNYTSEVAHTGTACLRYRSGCLLSQLCRATTIAVLTGLLFCPSIHAQLYAILITVQST